MECAYVDVLFVGLVDGVHAAQHVVNVRTRLAEPPDHLRTDRRQQSSTMSTTISHLKRQTMERFAGNNPKKTQKIYMLYFCCCR